MQFQHVLFSVLRPLALAVLCVGVTFPGVAVPPANPAGTLQLVATNLTVTESAGRAVLVVRRVGGKTGVVSVDYATGNETATVDSDYRLAGGTIYFSNGVTTRTITIPIINDAINEQRETFTVALGNPGGNATLGSRSQARVSIIDNDKAGRIAFGARTFQGSETGGVARVVVVRTGGKAGGVSVRLSTSPLSAEDGPDYEGGSVVVSFGSNEMRQEFSLPIVNDTTPEGVEQLKLTLSDPTGGATLGSISNAVVNIVDDEFPVEGTYTVNGTARVRACADPSDNSTATLTGQLTLRDQVVNDFSGSSLLMVLSFDNGYGRQTLSGHVDSAGNLAGTNTLEIDSGLLATGPFTGKITGRNLHLSFQAVQAGGSCTFSGTLNGTTTPEPTLGFAPVTLQGASVTATNTARTSALRLSFSPSDDTYELTTLTGSVNPADGPYIYYRTTPNAAVLLLGDSSDDGANTRVALTFTSTTAGRFSVRPLHRGSSQSGTFVLSP